MAVQARPSKIVANPGSNNSVWVATGQLLLGLPSNSEHACDGEADERHGARLRYVHDWAGERCATAGDERDCDRAEGFRE